MNKKLVKVDISKVYPGCRTVLIEGKNVVGKNQVELSLEFLDSQKGKNLIKFGAIEPLESPEIKEALEDVKEPEVEVKPATKSKTTSKKSTTKVED